MNNQLVKFVLIICIGMLVAYFIVEPIVYNDNEYRIVVVNVSEHPISSTTITLNGEYLGKIGSVHVGLLNDFIFVPDQGGVLEYSIKQNGRELSGVINEKLQNNDTGQIFLVVSEMYNVRIEHEYKASEFLGRQ